MWTVPKYGGEEMLCHVTGLIGGICGPGEPHDSNTCDTPVRTVDILLVDESCDRFAPIIVTLPDGDPLFAALSIDMIIHFDYLDVHFSRDAAGDMVVQHFTNPKHMHNTIHIHNIQSIPATAPHRVRLLAQWASTLQPADDDDSMNIDESDDEQNDDYPLNDSKADHQDIDEDELSSDEDD